MLETHTLMLLGGFISKGKIRIDCFETLSPKGNFRKNINSDKVIILNIKI